MPDGLFGAVSTSGKTGPTNLPVCPFGYVGCLGSEEGERRGQISVAGTYKRTYINANSKCMHVGGGRAGGGEGGVKSVCMCVLRVLRVLRVFTCACACGCIYMAVMVVVHGRVPVCVCLCACACACALITVMQTSGNKEAIQARCHGPHAEAAEYHRRCLERAATQNPLSVQVYIIYYIPSSLTPPRLVSLPALTPTTAVEPS